MLKALLDGGGGLPATISPVILDSPKAALSTPITNSKNLLGYCGKVEKTDWGNTKCKCRVQKRGKCTTQYQSELGFKACPFHLSSQQALTLSNTKDADKEALIPAKRKL